MMGFGQKQPDVTLPPALESLRQRLDHAMHRSTSQDILLRELNAFHRILESLKENPRGKDLLQKEIEPLRMSGPMPSGCPCCSHD